MKQPYRRFGFKGFMGAAAFAALVIGAPTLAIMADDTPMAQIAAPAHTFTDRDINGLFGIIDMLKSGTEPSPEAWQALLDGPGYKGLVREEIPAAMLTESIRVAFLPAMQAELESWRQQDAPAMALVQHFLELDKRRDDVRALAARLSHGQEALSGKAMALAMDYVTEGLQRPRGQITVALTAFQKDARGYGDLIVIDPLFALEAGDSLVLWLAHETHHYLRHNLSPDGAGGEHTGADAALLWVLDQLQAEGIADQIDKAHIFFGDGYMAASRFAQYFRAEAENAPARIMELDGFIAGLAACEDACDGFGDKVRGTAKMAGHPLGFFMAGVIDRTLGRAALVENLDNPAQFLAAYNEAVRMDGGQLPTFSVASLKYVAKLYRL